MIDIRVTFLPSPAVFFANPTIMLFSRGGQPVAVGAWWREAVASASGVRCGTVHRAVIVTIYSFVVPWIPVSLSISCTYDLSQYNIRMNVRPISSVASMVGLKLFELRICFIRTIPMDLLVLQTMIGVLSRQKAFSVSCVTTPL